MWKPLASTLPCSHQEGRDFHCNFSSFPVRHRASGTCVFFHARVGWGSLSRSEGGGRREESQRRRKIIHSVAGCRKTLPSPAQGKHQISSDHECFLGPKVSPTPACSELEELLAQGTRREMVGWENLTGWNKKAFLGISTPGFPRLFV